MQFRLDIGYSNVGRCQLNAYFSVGVCDPVHENLSKLKKNFTKIEAFSVLGR